MNGPRRRWWESDLIGIPATLAAVAFLALALVLFFAIGAPAGLILGLAVVGLGLYLVSRTGAGATEATDVGPPLAESAQRVLVVANQGLADPGLVGELESRARSGPLEVRAVAPVTAASRARALAGDVDEEAAGAQRRLDAMLGALSERGIRAGGRVDTEAAPIDSLLDGLREFPADEVLLLSAREAGWERAETLAERIRAETGVAVTELGD